MTSAVKEAFKLYTLNIDKNEKIIRNSAYCKKCKNELNSENSTVIKVCKCGNIMIKGGKDYIHHQWLEDDFYKRKIITMDVVYIHISPQ